jgi:hypothetical protein
MYIYIYHFAEICISTPVSKCIENIQQDKLEHKVYQKTIDNKNNDYSTEFWELFSIQPRSDVSVYTLYRYMIFYMIFSTPMKTYSCNLIKVNNKANTKLNRGGGNNLDPIKLNNC